MTPRIAVVDYGMGNRRSVEKALEHVGARAEITRDHDALRAADGLVLPGVGAFPRAMRNLGALGLGDVIRERAAAGVPLLGVCLGMQLLFDESVELGGAAGLGLLPGRVTALEADGGRLPHIGWNLVSFARKTPLNAELPGAVAFYHVHSFACRPADDADVLATADYGERFVTAVARPPLFGVQFHPEKSSVHGLAMLGAFARLCAGVPA
ncbi:MAG: imidazole glycerol phosphate synthase, glutamine amidotransferase subunit [Solirubrobacterales bacterium]|nr:imidazole glycerol phosphate synthase, glutamine amidotransferase subunit [Solirubrobacterales bacterium]